MASEFLATTRALDRDGRRGVLAALLVGFPLLGAWVAWVILAEIPILVVSRSARLEIDQIAHPVEAPTDGRIVAVRVGQGDVVRRGDPIFELDADSERLEVGEAEAELTARRNELDAIEDQLAVEREALAIERGSVGAAAAEVKARLRQARVASAHARERNALLERLSAGGFVADTERIDARAQAEQNDAAAEALRRSVDGVTASKRLGIAERLSAIEALERQATVLAGQIATGAAKLARLHLAIDRRTIRAPIDGTMAELAPLTVGATLASGTRLGVVLPPGALHVTAELDPSEALGRVRIGQAATVRLDGFPWAQYGVLEATIDDVAGEVRDGTIRVTLALAATRAAVPVQHGLPGSVDIEVERASPAALVLRAAGKLLAAPVLAGDDANEHAHAHHEVAR